MKRWWWLWPVLGVFAVVGYFLNESLLSGYGISQPPSIMHLLGTDGYGRDYFLLIVLASLTSVLEALLAAVTAIAFSLVLTFATVLYRGEALRMSIRLASYVIESCPLIMWVFVLLIALSSYPMFGSVLIIFTLAAMPFTTTVLFGEIERIWEADFVKSVRLLGVSNFRVFVRNVLPNSIPVTVPVALNLLGAALTVTGAVGFLGFGNKSRVDLGSVLFASREHFSSNPAAFLSTAVAFLGIFVVLYYVKQRMLSRYAVGGSLV